MELDQKAAELRKEIEGYAELIKTVDPLDREYLNYLYLVKGRLEIQLKRLYSPPLNMPRKRILPKIKNNEY